MDDAFLDGIDDHFERLMKLNGNGRRNGASRNRAPRDRVLIEIIDRLEQFSGAQQKEVLGFVRSLGGDSDPGEIGQPLESEFDES